MELRHLRYFVTVAEALSFSRAAARLNIVQPALSMQVRQLEAQIGTELLSREGRSIRLTEAGRVFLEEAKKTLAQADRSISLAKQAALGEIGTISIGYNMPTSFLVFPKVVPAFKKKWPNIHLNFHLLKIPKQIDGLRRDELDLGFVWLPIETKDFEVTELLEEPLLAVVPVDHRLASLPSISIKDLSGEPLVFLARETDSLTYEQIEQLFIDVGATMNVAYELENSVSMINFVAMGCGCSILPGYIRKVEVDGVVFKQLRPNVIKTLGIIRKKGRTGLPEVFHQFTLDNLRRGRRTRRR